MPNLGSIPALIADADSKVTTNGNGENTGARVNELFNNLIDTLTGSPVVGSSAPQAVFASAAQGQLAQTALQPGANVSLLANDAGYITSAPATLLGNVAVVDAVNGDNATAVVGNASKPFLTLIAAQTAATAGTTVLVLPGSYTSGVLGKNGVNWLFLPGATVAFTASSAFSVNTTNVAYKVRGSGVFNCTSNFVQATQSGANIDVECDAATYLRVDQTNGTIRIRVNGTAQPATVSPILGGTLDFSAKDLVYFGAASSAFQVFGGSVTIRDTAFAISGTADYAVLKNSAAGTVVLINTVITGGTNSLYADAAAEFGCVNVLADTAVGADVTVIGNMQINAGAAIAGDYPIAAADGTWTWSQP
jgi:hypothetical protein